MGAKIKWGTPNDRVRCKAAGVPAETKFRTRHELALEMLDEAGSVLPHEWVAGDDEMGRSSGFRLTLRTLRERYLFAVPSNTLVRDLGATPPEYTGRGRPSKTTFMRADRWRTALPESAWTKIEVRDGEKEPLTIEGACLRVQARTDQQGPEPGEVLCVTCERLSDGTYKHDYYLSNADPGAEFGEFARVAKAAHRIEECLKRGKSESGLGDYEVRTWRSWHHHQAVASGDMVLGSGGAPRKKKTTPAMTVPQLRMGLAMMLQEALGCGHPQRIARNATSRLQRNEKARLYHDKRDNCLAPLRAHQRY